MGPSAVHGARERTGRRGRQPDPGIHNDGAVPAHAPEFVRAVTAEMMAKRHDGLEIVLQRKTHAYARAPLPVSGGVGR